MSVLDLVRQSIRRMEPYKPGKSVEYVKRKYGLERVVKLASNENPYGPSPKAIEALKSVDPFKLSVYPETFPQQLLEAIEEHTDWDKERVVIGAGLDGVLETTFRMLVSEGDAVLLPTPTYPYYHTIMSVFGARGIFVKRKEDFSIDVDGVQEMVDRERPKLVIICSPNNPTGNAERMEDVRAVVEFCEGKSVVFVDEAYGEFADYEGKSLKSLEGENLIIGRTLSKAFALASLRVGYAVMSEELREEYLKATTPFPVTTPSCLAASEAMRDREHLNSVVESIVRERERIARELGRTGLKVYDSSANFLLVEAPVKAQLFVEELMKRGVIVRDCSSFYGCRDNQVRISVGREEDNDFMLEVVEEVMRLWS